jgi:predicted MFS family arabinose efflux permease
VNFVLELCGPERAASYTAAGTVFTGPFRAAMPMIGAALIPAFGYRPVFMLAAGVSALALLALSRRVVEPRAPTEFAPLRTGEAAFAAKGAE